jgi:tetratricopeptide (TPR) repeat protein
MGTDTIETLIERNDWAEARRAIEAELAKDPDDHWLWARLSGVKYEQRDYQGTREAAEKALEIVPDCPLAHWSMAGALDMLGQTAAAGKGYAMLVRRGIEELLEPDEDAKECWEGPAWTSGLVMDCIFRGARCQERLGNRPRAVELYEDFINLLDYHRMQQGIHTREEAAVRLKKLGSRKEVKQDAMKRVRDMAEALETTC